MVKENITLKMDNIMMNNGKMIKNLE